MAKSLERLQKHWPERQNSDEDGLLVDMPSKHEWSQSAEKKAAQEPSSPTRTPPEGHQGRLQWHKYADKRKTKSLPNSAWSEMWLKDPPWEKSFTQQVTPVTDSLSIYSRVRNQVFMGLTRMESTVHTSVTEGEMEGRTVCWKFWTNPPVMEARGRSASCSNFSLTPEQVHERCLQLLYNNSVSSVKGPRRKGESHQVASELCQARCRGPRYLGPSRHDTGPVWRGRAGPGPVGADPENKNVLSGFRCSMTYQDLKISHQSNKWPEGQSANRSHDAAEGEQVERTEPSPADRTICMQQTVTVDGTALKICQNLCVCVLPLLVFVKQ